MGAGPGPICDNCNDDKWRLSERGWCDDCERTDRGRKIARHYPLHRIYRETLAIEIASALADAVDDERRQNDALAARSQSGTGATRRLMSDSVDL